MKIFGVDTEKSYTDEEINAIRERWDRYLRNMVVGTFLLCLAMVVGAYIIQSILK